MYQIYFAQMSVCVNSSDIEFANKFTEFSVIPISYLDLVIDSSVIGSIRYDLIIRSHINFILSRSRASFIRIRYRLAAKLRWFDSARSDGFLSHPQQILIPNVVDISLFCRKIRNI